MHYLHNRIKSLASRLHEGLPDKTNEHPEEGEDIPHLVWVLGELVDAGDCSGANHTMSALMNSGDTYRVSRLICKMALECVAGVQNSTLMEDLFAYLLNKDVNDLFHPNMTLALIRDMCKIDQVSHATNRIKYVLSTEDLDITRTALVNKPVEQLAEICLSDMNPDVRVLALMALGGQLTTGKSGKDFSSAKGDRAEFIKVCARVLDDMPDVVFWCASLGGDFIVLLSAVVVDRQVERKDQFHG